MRVVAGRFRGRRLAAPVGRATRPTADRVRQAIFDVLTHGAPAIDFPATTVLDVFAGAGAMGIEALSRGARHATFIDQEGTAIACIRRNVGALGAGDVSLVLKLDIGRLGTPPRAAQAPCGLAFLDPPYGQGLAPTALHRLAALGWLAAGAWCVVEVGAQEAFRAPATFEPLDERTHGAARVIFLRRSGDAVPDAAGGSQRRPNSRSMSASLSST
jgi:16S rRNA (guanine966-N2)-methyltransferase